MIHEQIPQEKDLEVSFNPYQQEDNINDSWIISDEDQILNPKIEEFLGCLSPDPLCTQEYEDQISKELHNMKNTIKQGNKYYIEFWFQSVIGLQHHSILQHSLAPFLLEHFSPHIWMFTKVHFLNLDMHLVEISL
jgi:hypothetical protein